MIIKTWKTERNESKQPKKQNSNRFEKSCCDITQSDVISGHHGNVHPDNKFGSAARVRRWTGQRRRSTGLEVEVLLVLLLLNIRVPPAGSRPSDRSQSVRLAMLPWRPLQLTESLNHGRIGLRGKVFLWLVSGHHLDLILLMASHDQEANKNT